MFKYEYNEIWGKCQWDNNPKIKLYQKCLLLRNYKSDSIQTTQECSLDSLLQSLGFFVLIWNPRWWLWQDLQIPQSVSTFILSGRIFPSQDVWFTPEKCPINLRVNTLQLRVFGRMSWVHSEYLVGRESGYLKIFFYISRGEHVKHFVIDVYSRQER
jgi:hypothetical protein